MLRMTMDVYRQGEISVTYYQVKVVILVGITLCHFVDTTNNVLTAIVIHLVNNIYFHDFITMHLC